MNRQMLMPMMLSTLVAGCVAGPDYKGPPPVADAAQARGAFHRAATADATGGEVLHRWWQGLEDSLLSELIEQGLADSPTLAAANARVGRARALARGQKATGLPQLGAFAAAAAGHIDVSKNRGDDNVDLRAVGFDASWEVDLGGGVTRGTEAAMARTAMAEADRDDARLRLAAEIGQSYISLREAQQRWRLAERAVELQREWLALVQQRRDVGAAKQPEVEQRHVDLAAAEGDLARLRGSMAGELDRLAYLVGREPGSLDERLSPVTDIPMPPSEVAVSDPAALLRHRPDIRAAERRLAASNAAIGQAMAARFPKISLTGLLGFSLLDLGGRRGDEAGMAAAFPVLRWSLLDFGRTAARIEDAREGSSEAEAIYRDTVLAALADAEGALTRYGQHREQLVRIMRQLDAARVTAALADERAQAGAVSRIEAIMAASQALIAGQQLRAAEGRLATAYIALQKSLGLGWATDKAQGVAGTP